MPFNHEYIVCFGRDQMLLHTRRQLLQQAGYAALSTSSELFVTECLLTRSVSVLILCHTLSTMDVEVISRFHRDMGSTASIVCLSAGEKEAALNGGQQVNVLEGPGAFLAAVRKVNPSPNPSH